MLGVDLVDDMRLATGPLQLSDDRRLIRRVILLLGAYFAANLILRITISPSVAFDESEMVVVTQRLAWGYNTPPPLFPWIQWSAFRFFGINVFALALVKNLVLFGIYLTVYLCAREVLADRRCALLAPLSLFLVPTFVWEALRSQTHSALATLMAALTLLIFLQLLKKPSPGRYLTLGAVAGLGTLSYYNFTLFAGSLGLAALSTSAGRRRLLHRNLGLSILTLAVLVIPHGLWLVENHSYLSELALKFAPEGSKTSGIPVVGGLLSLSLAVFSFLALLSVFTYWIVSRVDGAADSCDKTEIRPILGRTFAIALAFCALVVLITGASEFKDRWLEPLLFFVPIYFLIVAGGRINREVFKKSFILAGAAAVLSLTVLHARIPMAGALGRVFPLNYPSQDIAEELRKVGFSEGTIVAENQSLGGNMRLCLPSSQVVVPFKMEQFEDDGRPVIVIWDSSHDESIPQFLGDFVMNKFGEEWPKLVGRPVSAPYLYVPQRLATIMYVRLLQHGNHNPVR